MITKEIETKIQKLWDKIHKNNLCKQSEDDYFFLPTDKQIAIGYKLKIVGLYVPCNKDKYFCLVKYQTMNYTDMCLEALSTQYLYHLIISTEVTINSKLK